MQARTAIRRKGELRLSHGVERGPIDDDQKSFGELLWAFAIRTHKDRYKFGLWEFVKELALSKRPSGAEMTTLGYWLHDRQLPDPRNQFWKEILLWVERQPIQLLLNGKKEGDPTKMLEAALIRSHEQINKQHRQYIEGLKKYFKNPASSLPPMPAFDFPASSEDNLIPEGIRHWGR